MCELLHKNYELEEDAEEFPRVEGDRRVECASKSSV